MSPNHKADSGLWAWDILWVDSGPGSESQLRTFLEEDKPPREVLVTGPCGALVPDFHCGEAIYANEVLDPRKGPHWPRPPRALSLPAVRKALGAPVHSGKFLTTEVPCVTPSHKLESGHGYGAIGVDQDSANLCRPCADMDLGHAVVRFVLDPAEVDLTPGVPGVELAFFEGARDCEIALFSLLSRL
jgi:hypothetical protein